MVAAICAVWFKFVFCFRLLGSVYCGGAWLGLHLASGLVICLLVLVCYICFVVGWVCFVWFVALLVAVCANTLFLGLGFAAVVVCYCVR